MISLFGCTTQKNTFVTRTFHNTTARYNVYFNGYESFDVGTKSISDEYKDNFNQILPVFLYSDDDQIKAAAGDMETALTKGAKAITNHSITVKPKIKNSKDITQKDKDFYEKNEYCKWIDDSYLLMGKANFYTQEYTRAMRSFRLIMNQYKDENTRFEAMLWLAKTYLEQEKFEDCEQMLNELESDVRHPKNLNREINLTYADLYIRQELFPEAIKSINTAIELTKNKRVKARYVFILAQIYEETGDFTLAQENYKEVIKMNPPYDLAFNAKIKRATISDLGAGEISEIKKQLKKLLKDEKNIDYHDQIYYAYANIELKEGNESKAIEYYKLSAKSSVSNDIQKAISYLALADIYFARPDYLLAGAYYDSTMQFINDDYYDYEAVSIKAANLSGLVVHLKEVQLQDSLQELANMSESERNQIIDEIIEDVITAEEEAAIQTTASYIDPMDNIEVKGASWYFYNSTAVSLGITEFKKKWGNRTLEDNWRRRNKDVILDFDEIDETEDEDSTRITDNKTREFYLQDIPLTDSLMKVSHNKIIEALFNAGDIYYKKMEDYKVAILTFEDLNNRYSDNIYKLEAYYSLYQLNLLLGQSSKAEFYKNQIISNFPESKYAKILLDPSYIDHLIAIEEQANILYDKTLTSYKTGNYSSVISNADFAFKTYPDSETLPKFLYLKALSYGGLKDNNSLLSFLNDFITQYPNDDAVAVATEIIALIESGKFDMDIYSEDFTSEFIYVIALKTGSFDLNEVKFKLTVASGNYSKDTKYEISEEVLDDVYTLITIKTFTDKVNALGFYNELISSFTLSDLNPEDYEHFIISENNFETLKTDKFIEKYLAFFKDKIY